MSYEDEPRLDDGQLSAPFRHDTIDAMSAAGEAHDDRYFHALLKEYENARSDDRNWFLLAGAFITLVVTALGAVGFGVESDTFKCLKADNCGRQTDLLLVLFPLAPLGGLGMIALAAMQSALRTRYMNVLESEIRRLLGFQDAEVRSLPRAGAAGRNATERGFLFRWTDLSSGVNETRRGQTLYRLVVQGLFGGITLIYAGLLVYIGMHIGSWSQAALTGIYTVASAILIGALLKSWFGTDALWEEVTTGLAIHVNRQGATFDDPPLEPMPGREDRPHRKSLMGYLLFPRKGMFVLRTVLTILAVGVFAYWLSDTRPSRDFAWVLGVTVLAVVVFEWGPYSARNQWTDLRRRERIPVAPTGASHRANLYTSGIVLALRALVPFIWIEALAPHAEKWVGIVAAVLFGSVLIDSISEFIELRLNRRTRPTLVVEVVGRAVAFAAQGIFAWRLALFCGAHIDRGVWWAGIAVFALMGVPWVVYQQYRDDSHLHPEKRSWWRSLLRWAVTGRHTEAVKEFVTHARLVVGEAPMYIGKLLFGRAFDQWLRRNGAGLDEIDPPSRDASKAGRVYEWTVPPEEGASNTDVHRNGHVIVLAPAPTPTAAGAGRPGKPTVVALVDPPRLTAVQRDELRGHGIPTDIVLTSGRRGRDVERHQERWSRCVLRIEGAEAGDRVVPFAVGERLWDEVAVVRMPFREAAFLVGQTLIVGDALCGGGSDSGIPEGEIGSPLLATAAEREIAGSEFAALLELDFDSICFSTGAPVTVKARAALRRFLEREGLLHDEEPTILA